MTIREALRLAAARLEQAGVPDADVDAAYLLGQRIERRYAGYAYKWTS